MRIDGIQPSGLFERAELLKKTVQDKRMPSFKDTLAVFLKDVNETQKIADDAQMKFLTGEVKDVHQVMSKSEEAKVSFNMLMELRNKSVDGLQELLRTKL
jgi:flagellar hook-basal body complex protein FliE